MSSETLTSTKL